MLQRLLKILLNRTQVQLFDTLLDILIATLQEYRRNQQNGNFDTYQNPQEKQNFNPFSNIKKHDI